MKLTVNFVQEESADDVFDVTVSPIAGRSGVNLGRRRATFDIKDNTPVSRRLDPNDPQSVTYSQIPIIHEVTHMLGRLHPGQYVEGVKPRPNSPADYRVDPGSLTGIGMELRDSDFQGMFCSKIRTRRRDCSKWLTVPVDYMLTYYENKYRTA